MMQISLRDSTTITIKQLRLSRIKSAYEAFVSDVERATANAENGKSTHDQTITTLNYANAGLRNALAEVETKYADDLARLNSVKLPDEE